MTSEPLVQIQNNLNFSIKCCYTHKKVPVVLNKTAVPIKIENMGDFKNNASISLINVYRLSKADL